MKQLIKIKPAGVNILLLTIAALSVIAALDNFQLIDLTMFASGALTIGAAILVFVEVGWMDVLKSYKKGGKKPDAFRTIGVVVAFLAILGVLLNWISVSFGLLNNIQGGLNVLVTIYVLIEAFR